jgi:hypothetical protein
MPDKLITIAKYNDFLSADIDRQILEDNGIKASVSGQSASGVFSGLPTLSYVELQVFEQDAEKALEILSEMKKQNPPEENPYEDNISDEDDFEGDDSEQDTL